MNYNNDVLTNLNSNANYDLKCTSTYLFENDEWPNPYLDININSMFHDHDSFISMYSNYSYPIFISLNVQSLMSKFDNLKSFILSLVSHNVPLVVIALQEIWSLPCPNLVDIPGFKFVFKSRVTGKGGGVGFYIRDDLHFNIVNASSFHDSQFENITVDITISKKKYF
jgi:hypothetical protein